VAIDIAKVLGYVNPQKAVRDHCKNVDAVGVNDSFTLDPQTIIIPERDVYRLIMRSKLPSAEKFEEWVVGDVLPSIRKTGKYEVAPSFQLPTSFADALKLAYEQQLQLEVNSALLLEMKPKADFFDQVTESTTAIDIGTAAKVLNMGIGRTKLFEFLRNAEILMQSNRPYQRFIDLGYFRVIEQSWQKPDGSSQINFKTVVYQKGLAFIRQQLVKADSGEVVKVAGEFLTAEELALRAGKVASTIKKRLKKAGLMEVFEHGWRLTAAGSQFGRSVGVGSAAVLQWLESVLEEI
jgi:prophage antirepressor-like protein